jgi:hypothetical protein
MVIINQNTVKLCRAGSCCPSIEKIPDNNSFVLRDDHGGTLLLTQDELSILKEAITHFENQ